MDRAPIEALTGTKACRDCAHYIHDGVTGVFSSCGAAPKVNDVTGEPGFYQCATQRMGSCGPQAIHFAPTADFEAKRSVRRSQLAKAIEDGIKRLCPDMTDAGQSIIAPLASALEVRYGDHAIDVKIALQDLSEALEAAEGTPDLYDRATGEA